MLCLLPKHRLCSGAPHNQTEHDLLMEKINKAVKQ
jgi:hypothetical protein